MSVKGLRKPTGVKNRIKTKKVAKILASVSFSGDVNKFLSDVCMRISPFDGDMAVPHDVLRIHGIDPAQYPLKGTVLDKELIGFII